MYLDNVVCSCTTKLAMEWKLFHFNCKKSVRDISGPYLHGVNMQRRKEEVISLSDFHAVKLIRALVFRLVSIKTASTLAFHMGV